MPNAQSPINNNIIISSTHLNFFFQSDTEHWSGDNKYICVVRSNLFSLKIVFCYLYHIFDIIEAEITFSGA